MDREPAAHKQTDPAKLPGQIVNPINHDMMDDMSQYAVPAEKLVVAAAYKPTHGGYPTPAPYATDVKRS